MAEQAKDPIRVMWSGCAWFIIGGAVIMVVHLLRTSSTDPLERFGPLVPMFAGAYGIVVGAEKMISGFRAGRAAAGPGAQSRATRMLLICGAIVVATLGAGAATYWKRAPYWDAVKGIARSIERGEAATQELRTIGEKHAIDLGEAPAGAPTLEIWRRTSEQGRLLKPEFVAAADASRQLAATAAGENRFRAEMDVKFYDLCIEWVDLYDRIHNQIQTQSIEEPPLEWALDYDDVINRIQELIEPPGGGQADSHEGHDHGVGDDPPQQPPPAGQ